MNHSNSAVEGSSSSTTQACAACRYQRRKCAPDCPLAPYFPASRNRDFQHAQKLFGVSNIKKILKEVKDEDKLTAMKSVVFEANMRAIYPVEGCLRMIRELESSIQHYEVELDFVLRQIAICRAQSEIQRVGLGCNRQLGFRGGEDERMDVGTLGTDSWDDEESLLVEKMGDLKSDLGACEESKMQVEF